MQPKKLFVTFDTNVYSVVAKPNVSRAFPKFVSIKKSSWAAGWRRINWWYLNHCIRKGRLVAAIPEPALKAEALRGADRVSYLANLGTSRASALPEIPETRRNIIEAAFRTGFCVLRSPRLAYGAAYPVPDECWAEDSRHSQGERQNRDSMFVRHFKNYPLEVIRDLGERLAAAHGLAQKPENAQFAQAAVRNRISLDRYLWREGLVEEENAPTAHATKKEYQDKLRALLADWADFDIAAVHYAYGFEILCTEDKGKPSSNSIFGVTYAPTISNTFDVTVMNATELAGYCWRQFGFPLRPWC